MTLALPEAILQSRRALDSARALWREGLVPECHAYMVAALRTMLKAWVPVQAREASLRVETATLEPEEQQALAELARAGYRRVELLRTALAATAVVTTPAALPPQAVSLPSFELPPDFEAIWAEAERLARFTVRRLTPPAARKKRRLILGAGLCLVLVFAGVIMGRLWHRPRASTSAVFGSDFPAAYAVDGIEATEWLMPDNTPGWLDVTFSSPRSVHLVRLLNCHNRYYADRAAQRVRVTAFGDWGPLGSVEGAFAALKAERSPLDLVLDAQKVTRLRVDVLSFFGRGGGLAEVEVR
jgi:hypothetical protein